MYEKLDRLREELQRAIKRREAAEERVRQLEEKLREAEGNQILADVAALKLTPEKLAELLKLATGAGLSAGSDIKSVVTENVEEREDDEYED